MAIAVLCALLAANACSPKPSNGPVCKAHDPGAIDLQSPVVSFKKDVVLGVFNGSCGFSSCHGSVTSSKGNLFLGQQGISASDASTVRQKIVAVASEELASMPFVTPGDPSKSFLMRKMDADQCLFDPQCVDHSCLESMPQGDSPLETAKRDTVRRWIAQGAQDN